MLSWGGGGQALAVNSSYLLVVRTFDHLSELCNASLITFSDSFGHPQMPLGRKILARFKFLSMPSLCLSPSPRYPLLVDLTLIGALCKH